MKQPVVIAGNNHPTLLFKGKFVVRAPYTEIYRVLKANGNMLDENHSFPLQMRHCGMVLEKPAIRRRFKAWVKAGAFAEKESPMCDVLKKRIRDLEHEVSALRHLAMD
jgi:hypothetical protein